MISFEHFIRPDGVPIYLAVVRHIERGVCAGTIQSGDELPSRRVLSALLGVNPNTIQKAYHLLEEAGLVRSHSGSGSVMVLDEEKICQIRRNLIAADAGEFIRSMTAMGLSKSETIHLLSRLWEE